MNIEILENDNCFVYKPLKKETVLQIANKFNVNKENVVTYSETLDVGDVAIISNNVINEYVCKPLDNLSLISKKINRSIEFLMERNNLKSEKVFIGQKLYY